jgi:hypothetical protein
MRRALLTVITLLCTSRVFAQTPTFEELKPILKPGELVLVKTINDAKTGNVVDVSASELSVILADKTRKSFRASEVSVVVRKDRLRNGAVKGVWWGLAAAIAPLAYIGGVCHYENGIARCLPAMTGVGLISAGAGASIGAFVDRLRVQVVYRQPKAATVP